MADGSPHVERDASNCHSSVEWHVIPTEGNMDRDGSDGCEPLCWRSADVEAKVGWREERAAECLSEYPWPVLLCTTTGEVGTSVRTYLHFAGPYTASSVLLSS